jgi:hypothetical protein
MTLSPAEFIRRFLLQVLPEGFQRIRHYGFLANGNRQAKLARIRELLPAASKQKVVTAIQNAAASTIEAEAAASTTDDEWQAACPECGGVMEIVETLTKVHPNSPRRIDTS